MNTPALEEIGKRFDDLALPFHSLYDRFSKTGLLNASNGNLVDLETFEAFRLTCTLWTSSKNCALLEMVCRKPAIKLLRSLAHDIKLLPADLRGDQDLGEEMCDAIPNNLYCGIGVMLWSCVRCVLVENPRMLE
jgi:nucleolar pre-ribosomal-associated protein 2